MRVLHLRASPFLGSPEKLLLNQCRRLDARRDDYLFAVFDEHPGGGNAFVARLEDLGRTVVRLPSSLWAIGDAVRAVVTLARREQVDVLCSHDYKSNAVGWLAAGRLWKPLVVVFHGRTSHDGKVRLYERLDDHVLRRSTLVVAVSQDGRRRLGARGVRGSRVVVIPNALDAESGAWSTDGPIRRRLRLAAQDPLLVFSGRLSPEKGVDLLLSAMERLVGARPRLTLVVLGCGPEEPRIRARVARIGLASNVHLLGFQRDVYPFLREMDFAVLPSLSEGMPLAILEAYAARKPVVATRVGGVPEVVDHGLTGLLVPPRDPIALAEAMEELIRDRERAAAMGEAGARRLAAEFTVKAQTDRYLEAFERALCANRPTTRS